MKVFNTESNLLLLYLKQRYQEVIYLTDIQEVYHHAPRWNPGKIQTPKVMLFKGVVNGEIKFPTWEGELYILGKTDQGQKLNLNLYDLLPDLKVYRKLFTQPCWHFLEKRYKTTPLICEWELSILLDWVSKGEGKPLIATEQVKELLQINPPSELLMTQYKKIWGTKEGAKFLYKLKDTDLWLLIHKYLEFHFQREKPELKLALQHTRNKCEQGHSLREEAIILNSLINKYTSSRN